MRGFRRALVRRDFSSRPTTLPGLRMMNGERFPRLTVTAGVRYEYERVPRPFLPIRSCRRRKITRMIATTLLPGRALRGTCSAMERTILRAGYGMFYGRIVNGTLHSALTRFGVTASQRTYRYSSSTEFGAPQFPSIFFSVPTGAARGALPSAYYFCARIIRRRKRCRAS